MEQLEGELEQALQALEVEKYNNAVLTQEVAKYKSGAAELQAKTMTAQENLTAKIKELTQAQATIKSHDQLIKSLEAELGKAQTDLEAELQNRQQMETELADLYVKQEEAAQTAATLEETRAQLDEAIANLETFENQLTAAKQQLDAQSAAKSAAEAKVGELSTQLEETKAYLEVETFNKEQAQQEVLDLKKNAASDREKMEKAIKEAKNQVRESRAIPQMQQISQEFAALQEQLEAEAALKDELEGRVR